MEKDDIIYLSLLIFTIIFGHFYRKISTVASRKWISTAIGFTIVAFVSGVHILHPIILVVFNAGIILLTSKKICHLLSFGFSFLYLAFFRTTIYFNIPYPPAHTNLIQMMLTLKLVGLAFEVKDSWELKKKEAVLDPPLPPEQRNYIHPSFLDIIHYSFCYIGVLTGPYYSYKTYIDYDRTGFYKTAPCINATLQKLKFVPIFAVVFLLLTTKFPLSITNTDYFYDEMPLWGRFLLMNVFFTIFRMRIYIGLTLSECACTMAGLGAYPVETKPRAGMGPTTKQELVAKLSHDEEATKTHDFDFETIHNIKPYDSEFEPSFRNTVKSWNMCIQYWLAFVIYKRFPSKALRTAAVFAISAYWHGVYVGYYFCLFAPPFYLPIEDIWEKILQRDKMGGLKKKIVTFLFWFVRTEAFASMGVAFVLLSTEKVLRFYKSTYYIFHSFCLIMLILGLAVLKMSRSKPPKISPSDKKEN